MSEGLALIERDEDRRRRYDAMTSLRLASAIRITPAQLPQWVEDIDI